MSPAPGQPGSPASHDNGPDPGSDPSSEAGSVGGRFNLLLSSGGWSSENWADHLPRLLEPLGVRTVRAHSGHEAKRMLESGAVFHIAVVDLALPIERTQNAAAQVEHEGGAKLLQILARLASPPPTVVIKRPRFNRDEVKEMSEALRLGAYACVDRPVDTELMLEVFRRIILRRYANRWPDVRNC